MFSSSGFYGEMTPYRGGQWLIHGFKSLKSGAHGVVTVYTVHIFLEALL